MAAELVDHVVGLAHGMAWYVRTGCLTPPTGFFRLDAFLDEWGADGFAPFISLEPRLADLERTIVAEIQAALEKPPDEERERA